MISGTQNCSISTRTAYFGTRRIAPVAATSRSKAWGARPAVEELRPARRFNRPATSSTNSELLAPAGTYVAQILGQIAPRYAIDPRSGADRYAAADALGCDELFYEAAVV